jgi:hypothetical protein
VDISKKRKICIIKRREAWDSKERNGNSFPMKMTAFWDIVPRILIEVDQYF